MGVRLWRNLLIRLVNSDLAAGWHNRGAISRSPLRLVQLGGRFKIAQRCFNAVQPTMSSVEDGQYLDLNVG